MWRCSIGIARSFSAPAPRPNSKITLWFSALMLISPAFLRAHISLPSDSQVWSGRGFQFACSETTIQRFLETLAASAPILRTSMMFTKGYLVFSHGKRARRKSPKADFSPKFANRAKTARFALSHSRDDDGCSVAFPMSRRSSPGLHSQMA